MKIVVTLRPTHLHDTLDALTLLGIGTGLALLLAGCVVESGQALGLPACLVLFPSLLYGTR